MNSLFILCSAAAFEDTFDSAQTRQMTMQLEAKRLALGLAVGGAVAAWTPALGAEVHERVIHERVGPGGRVHETVRVDRFHRVPPGFHGRVTVRVNPFHAHLGWRVNRFTPRERAMWTHGRWWHGRWHGRLGWWWWANGGWFFYDAPVYPYPDYVSETYYDVPGADYSAYWYYCRDPEGYYPYVQRCNGEWQPVAPQPSGGYDQGGYGPGAGPGGPDEYGPDEGGAPDQGPPGNYGPRDQGPPDDYGPSDQGGPDEQGPPPGDYGPDDQGPPDQGPPPR
jgi:hypothetical protein